MEDDKICEVGHILIFHFKHFLVDQFKPKPSVIIIKKGFIIIHIP